MASSLLGSMNCIIARCLTVAGLLTGLVGLCAGPAWGGDNEQRHGRQTCLVVDTDVATDDFRAFAVLFPHRDLRAVIVTEGIASVPRGSTAIALFLASGQSLAPVIPGLAAAAPPAYDWLPAARAAAERINGFLAAAVPFAASPNKLKLALAAALRGCHRVDVLVLGPWSSFVHYGPMLRPLIRRVVASGRPVAENNPDNFNCVYDQPACDKAARLLRTVRAAVWVDLPADGISYPPTQEMVNQLAGAGMPALLRAALNADPSQWLGTRLWDDTAALYVLAPEHFKPIGAHVEPVIDEEALRGEWVKAVNASPDD
jgi:inosine-uridine nucleoside N-ribohydrolase